MEDTIANDKFQEEHVPYIKREINGTVYTVKIHFNHESKETAKKKIERLLLNEAIKKELI